MTEKKLVKKGFLSVRDVETVDLIEVVEIDGDYLTDLIKDELKSSDEHGTHFFW